MKVLFIVPYPKNQAPSQRLKFEQYYGHFRDAGITVVQRPFISNSFWKIIYKKGKIPAKVFFTIEGYFRRLRDLFILRKYDVVYVHLWVTPLGPPVFEWLYRKLARSMVYDIDDLVYLSDAKSSANNFVSFLKGRRKPIYLMKHANHVITCTPYLDEFVRKLNQHTTDISSTINTDTYRPKEDYSIISRPLRLGWSGSHSTSKYLYMLEPVFRQLKEEGINFTVVVMGDPTFSIKDISVEAIPWKESYEIETIRSFDIGLYPLPDEQWVYGKSGLKALQYMACGVPTIATAIGANFRIIEDGVSGFLVHGNDEWYSRIKELNSDSVLRNKIGRQGANTVEEHYSINQNKHTYITILQTAAKS